jgi:hypothetical protein
LPPLTTGQFITLYRSMDTDLGFAATHHVGFLSDITEPESLLSGVGPALRLTTNDAGDVYFAVWDIFHVERDQ